MSESMCCYDPVTLTCPTCGHVALRLPTYRTCRPVPVPPPPAGPMGLLRGMGLGDITAASLAAIGVTKELVERLLGRPCYCPARQEWLNKIGYAVGIGKPPEKDQDVQTLAKD